MSAEQIKTVVSNYLTPIFKKVAGEKNNQLTNQINDHKKQISNRTRKTSWIVIPLFIAGGIAVPVGLVAGSSSQQWLLAPFVLIAIAALVINIVLMCKCHGANANERKIISGLDAERIRLNIPALEQIDYNKLLNLLLDDQFEKPVSVEFGFNKYKKDLFKVVQEDNVSFANIFSFTYNSYPMLLLERIVDKTYFQSGECLAVSVERQLDLYALVVKPQDLIFKSERGAFNGVKRKHIAMDLPKFDSLLPCSRNSESAFRVLFTPATQIDLVSVLEKDNGYQAGMAQGVLRINNKKCKSFPLFHDLNIVSHKDEIIDMLGRHAETGIFALKTLLQFFNALALYHSPFLQKQKHNYENDDIMPEEIEIYLNNSDNNYLFAYSIHGTISCKRTNDHLFTIIATSYEARQRTVGSGKHQHTYTYYVQHTDTFKCLIEKAKKNFSKYWKYLHYEEFIQLANAGQLLDIFELNGYSCIINKKEPMKFNDLIAQAQKPARK